MTDQTPEPAGSGRRGGYLPVLPDGWEYNVHITSSDDLSSIDVQQEKRGDEPTGRTLVHVFSSAGRKTITRDTLPEALRDAVAAARVLDRLAKTEAEYAAARQAALDSIGGDAEDDAVVDATVTDDVPQVADPVPAGSLAKDGDE